MCTRCVPRPHGAAAYGLYPRRLGFAAQCFCMGQAGVFPSGVVALECSARRAEQRPDFLQTEPAGADALQVPAPALLDRRALLPHRWPIVP